MEFVSCVPGDLLEVRMMLKDMESHKKVAGNDAWFNENIVTVTDR